jgi:hypothetical protein
MLRGRWPGRSVAAKALAPAPPNLTTSYFITLELYSLPRLGDTSTYEELGNQERTGDLQMLPPNFTYLVSSRAVHGFSRPQSRTSSHPWRTESHMRG